jgi:hypothetical protein
MTLAEALQNLDSYPDDLTIWAPVRTDLADLTADTPVVVEHGPQDGSTSWRERGLSYVLEVDIAKDVLKVWGQWRGGTTPTVPQMCQAVIHYAKNDAFLPTAEPTDTAS